MTKKNRKPDTPDPILIKLPFPTDEEILEIIRKYRCLVAHMICQSERCYEDATLVAVAIYRHIKRLPHDFDTYIWEGYDLAEDLKNPGREIMLQVGAVRLNRAFQNRHKHRRAQMIYQLAQMNIQDVLDHGVESDQFFEEFSGTLEYIWTSYVDMLEMFECDYRSGMTGEIKRLFAPFDFANRWGHCTNSKSTMAQHMHLVRTEDRPDSW